MTKPKCDHCLEVGEEVYYVWIAAPRGKEGKLVHNSCLERIRKIIDTIKNNKQK